MNTIKLNTIGDSPVVVKKGSQVQSQEKTVEITENGTTEVVPDAGYALSKVTVNTNVESGGSGEYPEVKPNGWYWKATSAQDSMTMHQRVQGLEGHLVLAAICETLTELNAVGFAESYFTMGRISSFQEGSGTIVYPPKYVQEAVPTAKLTGLPALNSVRDFYILQGGSEEEFLTFMESAGWQKITEEEYMAAKEALNS